MPPGSPLLLASVAAGANRWRPKEIRPGENATPRRSSESTEYPLNKADSGSAGRPRLSRRCFGLGSEAQSVPIARPSIASAVFS